MKNIVLYLNQKVELETRIENLLEQLSLEEKIQLCYCWSNVSTEICAMPRFGVGITGMIDGPRGVRLEDGRTATALPCGMALACSWDPQTAEEYGALLGRETLASGNHVILGPGINLMRTPLNGRSFEYFGEDPVLSGKIAAGYVCGCQGEGAGACLKHLAVNNQEICRTIGSSNVDERTLRELYLTAFEIAVREAKPWTIMSSYNKINGEFASACHFTQQQIVKDEWGFDGVVVSDFGGAHDTEKCVMGGLDLENGGGADSIMGRPLFKMIKTGKIAETVVDEKASRVLRLMFRTGQFNPFETRPSGDVDSTQHHILAKKLARQGMVLLKNENSLLPLDAKKVKTLAVIGPNADFQHNMGPLEACGGSGAVHPPYEITPLTGLRDYCNVRGIEVLYAPGILFDDEAVIPPSLLYHGDNVPGLQAEYFHSRQETESGAAPYLTAIDRQMHFCWNKRDQFGVARDGILPDRDFAVRWTGILMPDISGNITLMLSCLHGRGQVWLDEQLVIATDPAYLLDQGEYDFRAEAGRKYKLRIEFVCTVPEPELKLLWKPEASSGWQEALDLASQADAVIFCGGTNHHYDREALGWDDVQGADIPNLELIGPQAELIRELAAVNRSTAVVLTNGSVLNIESWIKEVPALLEIWYSGMEGGSALAEVLFGDDDPGGRLCCTWGRKLNDYACHSNGNYPGVRTGSDPHVDYDEGIFIGYRHFDRTGTPPRFPFGYGLSYTSFELLKPECQVLDATADTAMVKVRLKVKNTGGRAGAEVVQLYVGDDSCSIERPVKELKAFRKVRMEAGAAQVVELTLCWRDFAFWSPECRGWIVEPGTFTLYLGTSADNIAYQMKIELQK